jgi:ADP-heptose:LPS heptosyltransferase
LSGDYAGVDGIGPRGESPSSQRPRILIIRAGAIGDTLMATPLVRALRIAFPNAYLVFMCSSAARDVLKHNPRLDRVVGLEYRHVPVGLSPEKKGIIRWLRALDLDWALALESHRSFLDLACRVNAARLAAYDAIPARSIERVPFDPIKHCIENHLDAGEVLGAKPAGLDMELYLPPALKADVQRRLNHAGIGSGGLLVGLHAGWGRRPQTLEHTRLRSWPPERFAMVARWLTENLGARVVLTGSGNDRPLAEFIARHAAVPCLNLAGDLSLLELAALIDRLNLYVAVDSGPAHMAAALGTPLVTLWGPGIFQQTRPLAGRGTVHIVRHEVHCSPCYGTPLMKSCRDNICMKQIEVAEVQEAIIGSLAKGGRGLPSKTLPAIIETRSAGAPTNA